MKINQDPPSYEDYAPSYEDYAYDRSMAGSSNTPLVGDQQPPIPNGGQNPTIATPHPRASCFKGTFGTIGNGIFIVMDIVFWLTLGHVIFLALVPNSSNNYRYYNIDYYNPITWFQEGKIICAGIFLLASLGLEIFGTIKKNLIVMKAACFVTGILFCFFIYIIQDDLNWWGFDNYYSNISIIVCSFGAVWNIVRLAFQIKIISWIRTDNLSIPLLSRSGYQPI